MSERSDDIGHSTAQGDSRSAAADGDTTRLSTYAALRASRQRRVELVGQLERNQGLATFTGRLTLEQFTDLTVVHNKRWAEEAGESLDIVTQRDIIDGHANGLALFVLQGLIAATSARAAECDLSASTVQHLDLLQERLGRSGHYGLPQVTLVLPGEPDFEPVEGVQSGLLMRMFLPAGRLFVVADGQHRREAARRVRDFLAAVVTDRRIPRSTRFHPPQDVPVSAEEMEAWIAVQDTFRSWSLISYEAHIGLSVAQARQMFTNYNCNVKPVRRELSLDFDQSNPINVFAKNWVQPRILEAGGANAVLDLRQLAAVQGFLFLGKTSIKSAPYSVAEMIPVAQAFWNALLVSPEWGREGSLIREVPVIKGLAKAWFYVFLARRNSRREMAAALDAYIRDTRFDLDWMVSVPGLKAHTVPAENEVGFRFSPAHNDIVACVVNHAFGGW